MWSFKGLCYGCGTAVHGKAFPPTTPGSGSRWWCRPNPVETYTLWCRPWLLYTALRWYTCQGRQPWGDTTGRTPSFNGSKSAVTARNPTAHVARRPASKSGYAREHRPNVYGLRNRVRNSSDLPAIDHLSASLPLLGKGSCSVLLNSLATDAVGNRFASVRRYHFKTYGPGLGPLPASTTSTTSTETSFNQQWTPPRNRAVNQPFSHGKLPLKEDPTGQQAVKEGHITDERRRYDFQAIVVFLGALGLFGFGVFSAISYGTHILTSVSILPYPFKTQQSTYQLPVAESETPAAAVTAQKK